MKGYLGIKLQPLRGHRKACSCNYCWNYRKQERKRKLLRNDRRWFCICFVGFILFWILFCACLRWVLPTPEKFRFKNQIIQVRQEAAI